MTTTFEAFNLAAPIQRALADEGYTTPTPIQARAIGPIMEGRDVLGCAQTGTGKTAAFAVPVLHRLHTMGRDKSRRGPVLARTLVLSPTRELATQIGESFATYGRGTGLTGTTIFGGVSQRRQERELARGLDVIVATPGRLIDLMEQGVVDLSAIEIFVLDEADRMLDMGFIEPIRRISAAVRKERQTLLFSATMPRTIQKLADSLLRDPVKVTVTPPKQEKALIEQSVYMVGRSQKMPLLEHLIREGGVECTVVFTKTKHGADKVSRRLQKAGITSDAIHGNKSQRQRDRALDAFKAGRFRVLVATDVAARGLDVSGITHVFNFDLPMEPEAYTHRIGRTGRAGATGRAIAFCDPSERGLLKAIERETGARVPLVKGLPQLQAAEPDLGDFRDERDEGFSRERRGSGVRPVRASNPRRAPAPVSGEGRQGGGSAGGAGTSRPRRVTRMEIGLESKHAGGDSRRSSGGRPQKKTGSGYGARSGGRPGGRAGGHAGGRQGGPGKGKSRRPAGAKRR